METVYELFVEQLKDVYSAEQQLTKALPKMAKGATDPMLKKGIQEHLKETETHLERLDAIGKELGEKLSGTKCPAMEGLIEEGKAALDEDGHESVIDLGIIVAAQRVEHYEIAAYGNLIMFAERLGYPKIGKLLRQTLAEESKADTALTAITQKSVLPNAPLTEEDSEESAANE